MHVMHIPATSCAASIHQQWHIIVANWQCCKKCGFYTAYIQLVNHYGVFFGWNSETKQEVEVNVNGEINATICVAFIVKKIFFM